MTQRTPKTWLPRTERGAERWYADAEEVDLAERPGWKEYRAQHPEAIEWLLLARNGYMLEALEDMCKRQGFSYTSVNRNPLDSAALAALITWERMRKGIPATKDQALAMLKYISIHSIGAPQRDALRKQGAGVKVNLTQGLESPVWYKALDKISADERDWIRAARKRGETLTGVPRIRISTIHAAKGGEADHVLMLTDMSQRTYQEYERNPDNEHRVWYVGATRARKELHLVQPRTQYAYEI
jgi:hypothetical protein